MIDKYYTCQGQPVYNYILGIILCIGGIISYFPQYWSIIKTKTTKEGVSELSLFLLNVGSACLAANAFILNWTKFQCYYTCAFWLCTSNLLSMIQIIIGWIMVCPLYFIFIRYKIKNSEKRLIHDIGYVSIYVLFILIMIIVGLSEKLYSHDSSKFFTVSAKLLGISSAICSSIVWIPQIVKLLKTKKQGNLSLLMFVMQTPGNAIIIVLQILYYQNWTTWFCYVITLIEQGIIVFILLIFKYYDKENDPDFYIIDSYDYFDELDSIDEIIDTNIQI